MSTDKPRPAGLLSKMARLVRRTDAPPSPAAAPEPAPDDRDDFDASLGKQALRELIEQRRHNDFVRTREFAQLRRLRAGGTVPSASDARGSSLAPQTRASAYFTGEADSRLTDDRAGTLRKIDEIEAQMSQQWWKHQPTGPGRAGPSEAAAPSRPGPDAAPEAAGPSGTAEAHEGPFASTDIAGATQMPDMASTLQGGPWVAEDLPDFAHLPALDDAAIAFAQADYDHAESALRALAGADASPQDGTAETLDAAARDTAWHALFDFYRAVARHDRFETVALDYAQRFERSPPSWGVEGWTPDLLSPLAALAGGTAQAREGDDVFRWASPAVFDAAAAAGLRAAFDDLAPPIERHLDWSALTALADDAADPLGTLAGTWIQQPLALRFAGAERLTACLDGRTPSNDASVPLRWWQLRMDLLRLMDRPEAFDLAALDYCITYEVSPPSWQSARCDYRDLQAADAAGAPARVAPDRRAAAAEAAEVDPVLELAGEIAGDAADTIARLDAAAARSPRLLTVHCDRLLRTDFAAAGALLNWAAAQQAAGRIVRFHNLHRLVASFFHVLGMGEHARVHVRSR